MRVRGTDGDLVRMPSSDVSAICAAMTREANGRRTVGEDRGRPLRRRVKRMLHEDASEAVRYGGQGYRVDVAFVSPHVGRFGRG